MGACCTKKPAAPETAVLDSLQIRFPTVKPQELPALVRYGIAKEQQLRGALPGSAKREELLSILKIVLAEAATPETKELLEQLGEVFLGEMIDCLCLCATRGKRCSQGI